MSSKKRKAGAVCVAQVGAGSSVWVSGFRNAVAELPSTPEAVEVICRDYSSVYLLGSPANASLIWSLLTSGHSDSLWVHIGHPDMGRHMPPLLIMSALWAKIKDPEVWRKAGLRDGVSYLMSSGQLSSEYATLSALKAHPVWPLLSFVSGFSPSLSAKLLGYIRNPFFFRGDASDGRSLFRYLGLYSESFESRSFAGTRLFRAAVSTGAWTGGASCPKQGGPGSFLWSTYVREDFSDAGLLKATRQFVSCLVDYWRAAESPHPEAFVPEYAFGSKRIAERFREHESAVFSQDSGVLLTRLCRPGILIDRQG